MYEYKTFFLLISDTVDELLILLIIGLLTGRLHKPGANCRCYVLSQAVLY